MKAALIISHGSHVEKTKKEVDALIEKLSGQGQVDFYESAYLDIMQPDISAGIERCVERGADEIIILLNFLNSGRHVDEDIPNMIKKVHAKHIGLEIRITKPVGQHEEIARLFSDLLNQA